MCSNWSLILNTDGNCRIAEDETIRIILWGGWFWKKSGTICYDILEIAHAAIEHHASFDDIHGCYKVAVYEKKSNKCWLWGDNQGTMGFYIDDFASRVSDSFLTLRAVRDNVVPNRFAISQLFSAGFILSDDTIIQGIRQTSWKNVYWFDGLMSDFESKKLKSISENVGEDLHDIIEGLVNAFPKEKTVVCTGGTDSRTVLAHLYNLGQRPPLIITGHSDNPDIKPAKIIAETLGLSLDILDPKDHEEDWIQKGFLFSDGCYNPIDAYRQMKKVQMTISKGGKSEWGGVGGEYYKNSYCKYFLWRLWSKESASKINNLFSAFKSFDNWMAECLLSQQDKIEKMIETIIDSIEESNLLSRYNAVGFYIMARKAGSITNGYGKQVTKIDPLFERSVIAKASKAHPVCHAMAIWQRNEIHSACPILSDLPTDTGYTCTIKPFKLFSERVTRLNYWCSRVFARLKKKLHLPYIDSTQRFWDNDYKDAKETEIFKRSIEICKNLDLVSDNTAFDDIPLVDVGNILLVGMMFDK